MAHKYTADPTNVKNFTQSTEIDLDQSIQDYSDFLPEVNRTESIERFFGSTVNQLLSSGSTQTVNAFWGRVSGRSYNAEQDLFMEEADATRINYQFQPGTVSRSGNTTNSTTSYVNWLKRLESLGASTENHDRLFSEPGYVLDLPINIDMFTNYANYYWLEGDIPLINVDASAADPIDIDTITSVAQYTTPPLANHKSVNFQTGMRVKFTGANVTSTSSTYFVDFTYYVENVGGKGGIKLVPIEDASGNTLFPSNTPYEIAPKEGWDTVAWDTTPWDGTGTFDEYLLSTNQNRDDLTLNKSYIVMERWAQDMNPWARSNKWFSLYALRIATEYNDLDLEAYLNTRTRAERPIIEFKANMELFNTCKTYVETVDFVISLEQVTEMLSGTANFFVDPENALQNGDIVLVAKDEPGGIEIIEYNADFNPDFDAGTVSAGAFGGAFSPAYNAGAQIVFFEDAFVVSGVGTNITLTPHNTYIEDEYVIVGRGSEKGAIYCHKDSKWTLSQNKTERGTMPLFNLYDEYQVELSAYDNNNFAGDKVFGYKVNTTGTLDRELGFAPSFTNLKTFDDYEFEFTVSNNRYSQDVTVSSADEIPGYYYWKDWVTDDTYNGWSNIRGGQRVPILQTQIADGVNDPTFDLGTTDFDHPTEFTVTLESGSYIWNDHSYIDMTPIGYSNPEMIWKTGTNYTINALISDVTHDLEFVDPFGNTDANISVATAGTVNTVNIDPSYAYSVLLYRSVTDPTTFGEIHLNNNNQSRFTVTKNRQILIDSFDYTVSGPNVTVTSSCVDGDVLELTYITDTNIDNVVYDVAPVHFYNTQNKPYTGSGYAELSQHFGRQLSALPGFRGSINGDNTYHKTLRLHTFDGIIRQQIFETSKVQYLLDQEGINPVRALKTFAIDYANFKRHFKNKVYQLWTTGTYNSVRDLVDRAITDINIGKNKEFKYANSDMAYVSQYRELTYSITDTSTSFDSPNVINQYGDTQNHVQVWLKEYDGTSKYTERQLTKNIDYITDEGNIVLTSAVALDGGSSPATLTIRWYDYKQLSHIPFSTVKLGLFRPTQVEIIDGELIGHDGSRHTATGTEFEDMDSVNFDVVTAALQDYELRVFNNLVTSHFVTQDFGFELSEFYPNPHGEFGYNITDFNVRLDDWYNRFAVREGITEIDDVAYNAGNMFTWNYSTVGPNLGSWRSLYVYYFGTDRPHTHPWEMLGHKVKPTWWDANYSWIVASKRDALNSALQNGMTGNDVTPNYINVKYARNQYDWASNTLVTSGVVLNDPVTANVVTSPSAVDAAQDFVFGDWSEIENNWRKSSEYGFALTEVLLQLKPYRVHELFWSLNRWRVNTATTQQQWIDRDTCNRTHITELHNQVIDDGIIAAINVTSPGTGYSFLNIDFLSNAICSTNATALAFVNGGGVQQVAVTNTGRGYVNTPVVTLNGPIGSTGVVLEYILDFEFVVTHLGLNTLPAETFASETNELADTLENLDVAYMLHVGGYTDKRILSLEIDGDFNAGSIRVPESNYSILIDRNAPIKTAFYSGVKIEKVTGGFKVDGYNLDSNFFNYFRPSTAGKQVTETVGNVQVTRYLNWHNEVVRTPYQTTFTKRQELYNFLLGLSEYYETLGFEVNDQWRVEANAAIAWSLSTDSDPFFVNGIADTLTYRQGTHGVTQTVDVNYDGYVNVLDSTFKSIKKSELLVLRNETTTEYSLKDTTDRIYGLGVRVIEFEHIITIDNVSEFNDEFYKPETGIGQNRIKLVGERTRNWNGRVEAPGYLVRDTGLLLNIESSVRELEKDWINTESKVLERLTRQTIGYNVGYTKPTYMKDTFVGDLSAYRFEQGERKYKGTETAIEAMSRNKNIFGVEFEHELYEEWMVRLGDYGDVSERNPLQFAISTDKIKSSPQQFRFNPSFTPDRSDDLIIDLHKGSVDAISGNFDNPFSTYDVLRLDNTKISTLAQYQDFAQDAGLPLVSEIDNYLRSVDNIAEIYDPTQPYALVPNWNQSAAYVEGDEVRLDGKVYRLNIPTTGLTGLQDEIIVRATQVFPSVANGLTFIANGNTVTFSKSNSSTTFNTIVVDGTVSNPTVTSGNTLTLDGVNVNFIKTVTSTTYADIVIAGNVTNPTVINSASNQLIIFHADAAAPAALSTVTVDFDELSTTLPMQDIWSNALTTAATAADPVGEAVARIDALEVLRAAYVGATSVAAWQTFIDNYFATAPNPDRFINPEYLGAEVLGNPGAAWETAARALIDLDLALIADLSNSAATETQTTMVSGVLNNAAQFDLDRDAANNLLDDNVTPNNDNVNLKDFVTFVETNGGTTIAAGQAVTVTHKINYVVDTVSGIANKINAALTLAGVTDIASSPAGNIITLTRSNTDDGYRLGVSVDGDIGFTVDDADIEAEGTTATVGTPLSISESVQSINNAAITGVTAIAFNNKLRLQSVNETLVIGSSTALTELGLSQGTTSATTNIVEVPVDLAIGDVVTQINDAAITDLTASQVSGVLVLTYTDDTLIIGAGTANSTIGLTEQTLTSRTEEVQNAFNASDWVIIQDPAHFNIWTIDNIGSSQNVQVTSSRYDVYQTLDFQIGVDEICVGNESGDDALISCNRAHTLSTTDYVLIVNSTCVPSADGIHRVTGISNDNRFFIDRYIEQKGFTGKVFPLRSVRFSSSVTAANAMTDAKYVEGALGLRSGDFVYADSVLDINTDPLGYGAVYKVERTTDAAGLFLVRNETGKTNNSIIKNGILYDNETGNLQSQYEVYDPLKGIIPGIAEREIDVRSDDDRAYYNNSTDPNAELDSSNAWGRQSIGKVWWDLSNAIYLNYDQGTLEYRQAHWAELFPTSTIDIYEWTKSPVTPDEYIAAVNANTVIDGVELTGIPYAVVDQYGEEQFYWTEEVELNSNTNQLETYFYYWVSHKTTTPNIDRDFSTIQLADIVFDPTSQQLDWIAASGENNLLVSSLDDAVRTSDLVMQVNFDTNTSDYHQEYAMLAENDPSTVIPEWLHISLRDSLAGFTQSTSLKTYVVWDVVTTFTPDSVVLSALGNYFNCHTTSTNNNPDTDSDNDFWTLLEAKEDNPDGDYSGVNAVLLNTPQNIPDLDLHPAVRYGLETRPHQTWFKSVDDARKVLVNVLNSQFININLVDSDLLWKEEFDRTFTVGGLDYDITEYWNFVDWTGEVGYVYARGVGDFFVNATTDLSGLTPVEGNIAHVETSIDVDGRNRNQVYRFTDGVWVLIFKEKATIKFNDLLWDNTLAQTGWDMAPWDTEPWDKSSSTVAVEIFDSFYNTIWVDEHRPLYADVWFSMVKHVLNEQPDVDWIFKSSYIKLITEDTLEKQYNKYFSANIDELFDYINTVKPFRTKIREAILRKTADDEAIVNPLDAVEIRVQTNVVGSTVDEDRTRSFRFEIGSGGLHYATQIANKHKVLLSMNISPTDTVIPYTDAGSTQISLSAGVVWINGERIEYTGKANIVDASLGSGFSAGFSAGFGSITLLTGCTRGTQGTFARKHSYMDVIEEYGNFELAMPTTLSDIGNTITPAWNQSGKSLLDFTNLDPNGITIRSEGFGTIDAYGELLTTQQAALAESTAAINAYQADIEGLIEVYLATI